MTPEIGQLCLILALCVAAIQSVLPVAGAQFGNPAWIAVARPAAVTQLLFVALAFICYGLFFDSSRASLPTVTCRRTVRFAPMKYWRSMTKNICRPKWHGCSRNGGTRLAAVLLPSKNSP